MTFPLTSCIDPILLVGAQRSGTTALGCALSVAVADQGGVFTVNGKLPYYLKRWWTEESASQHARADEVIHSLHRRRPLGVGVDEWLARTERSLKDSSRRIAELSIKADPWDEMRRICRSAYGAVAIWGDKYNEYLLDLPFLHILFPQATWVFLAREPHQVVASMMEWDGDRPWNPQTVEACALKWATWNQHWLDFRVLIPTDRRIELVYHQVVCGCHHRLDVVFGTELAPYLADYRDHSRPLPTQPQIPAVALDVWETIQRVADLT